MLENSAFIARLVGPIFLVSAGAMLVNRKGFQEVIAGAARNPAIMYLTGIMTLLFGLTIVQVHPIWTSDWSVMITGLGWLSTIGGGLRMLFPDRMATLGAKLESKPGWTIGSGLAMAVLGGILTFKGFQPPM